MATYGTMKSRIATEMSRSDLTTVIPYAIQDAIRFYQGTKFWFNEDGATTPTVAAQADYALPTDFIELDYASLTVNGATYPLKPVQYRSIAGMNVNNTQGVPQYVATYQESLWLYPVPNAVYTVTFWYTRELDALSGDSDTNAWTTEAEELIRIHAKKMLCLQNLHNPQEALALDEAETRVLAALKSETERRIQTEGTKAWW